MNLRRPLDDIRSRLTQFDWDSHENLVTLRRHHVANILRRFIDTSISAAVVEEWADALEVREDVEFEQSPDDVVGRAVNFLANPSLHGLLTPTTAAEWLHRLVPETAPD